MAEKEGPMKLVEGTSDTSYIFELKNNKNSSIDMKLEEDGVYAPFTYEAGFTKDDFIAHHKAFRGCVDLEEIMDHLTNLYGKEKIELYALGPDSQRELIFKIYDISKEDEKTETFNLTQKMVENKDEALKKLYEIQKNDFGKMKKIKEYLENHCANQDPIRKKVESLLSTAFAKI